MLLMMQHKTK